MLKNSYIGDKHGILNESTVIFYRHLVKKLVSVRLFLNV